MILTGIGTAPLPSMDVAVNLVVERLYQGLPLPLAPITEKTPPKDERNYLICEHYAKGDTLEVIAETFNISLQRVHQIICPPHRTRTGVSNTSGGILSQPTHC